MRAWKLVISQHHSERRWGSLRPDAKAQRLFSKLCCCVGSRISFSRLNLDCFQVHINDELTPARMASASTTSTEVARTGVARPPINNPRWFLITTPLPPNPEISQLPSQLIAIMSIGGGIQFKICSDIGDSAVGFVDAMNSESRLPTKLNNNGRRNRDVLVYKPAASLPDRPGEETYQGRECKWTTISNTQVRCLLSCRLQRLLNTIRELEERSQTMIHQTRQQTKQCLGLSKKWNMEEDEAPPLTNCGKKSNPIRRTLSLITCNSLFCCITFCDLELTWLVWLRLRQIDSHVKRLDEDLHHFAEDLKQEGKI
ncbi:hypothetical protein ACLB2K_073303 [Fragaria x ananassa]